MVDFATLRKNMVFGQLLPNRINHPLLLRAFETVPREQFCPKTHQGLAYSDGIIPLSGGRFMLAPLALARLIMALEIAPTDKVLDVGCGTGYSSAIANFLSTRVIGIEQDAHLFQKEKEHLQDLGYPLELHQAVLSEGYPKGAPFDAILIQGASDSVPESLVVQLKEGGKMALFLKEGAHQCARGTLVQRIKKGFTTRPLFDHEAPMIDVLNANKQINTWSDFYAV